MLRQDRQTHYRFKLPVNASVIFLNQTFQRVFSVVSKFLKSSRVEIERVEVVRKHSLMSSLFPINKLISKDGPVTNASLENKTVGIYFSVSPAAF